MRRAAPKTASRQFTRVRPCAAVIRRGCARPPSWVCICDEGSRKHENVPAATRRTFTPQADALPAHLALPPASPLSQLSCRSACPRLPLEARRDGGFRAGCAPNLAFPRCVTTTTTGVLLRAQASRRGPLHGRWAVAHRGPLVRSEAIGTMGRALIQLQAPGIWGYFAPRTWTIAGRERRSTRRS